MGNGGAEENKGTGSDEQDKINPKQPESPPGGEASKNGAPASSEKSPTDAIRAESGSTSKNNSTGNNEEELKQRKERWMRRLIAAGDALPFFMVLIATLVLLYALIAQVQFYGLALDAFRGSKTIDSLDPGYVRSTVVVATKIFAHLVGFILILLGSFSVVRAAETEPEPSKKAGPSEKPEPFKKRRSPFSASSPGLALVALGLLLIILVLFAESAVIIY